MTPDTRLLASAAGTLLGVLLLVLLGAWGGYAWRDNAANAELAECKRLHAADREAAATAARAAEAAYRTTEARRAQALQEITDAAHLDATTARADADRVRAALERLRRHLATAPADGGGAAAYPTLAAGSPPAVTTPDLPADLLGRLGGAAGELAAYADAARTAGTACERAYQSVSDEITMAPPLPRGRASPP